MMNKILITVYVVPQSSKSVLCGLHDGLPKIKIKAPPVEGKANEELIQFLSRLLELPERNIEVLKGSKSRRKQVQITPLTRSRQVEDLEEKVRRILFPTVLNLESVKK